LSRSGSIFAKTAKISTLPLTRKASAIWELDRHGILVAQKPLHDRKDVADGIRHLVPPPPQSSSGMSIPDHAIERLARCMLPMIQRYYDSEEEQKELKNWENKQRGGCKKHKA